MREVIRKILFFFRKFKYFYREVIKEKQQQADAILDYTEKLNKENWPEPGKKVKAEPGLKRKDFYDKETDTFPAWIEEKNGEYTISKKWI